MDVFWGVMARLARVEFADAVYHAAARGNERKAIYTGAALKCPVVGLFRVIIAECGWTRQNGLAIRGGRSCLLFTNEP